MNTYRRVQVSKVDRYAPIVAGLLVLAVLVGGLAFAAIQFKEFTSNLEALTSQQILPCK